MIAAERDPEQALALIDEAREHTKAAGQSTATWDLAELELHITSNNVDEAKELLARIERDHRDDPQVAAALYQLLYETGVIPDQMAAPAHRHSHAIEPAPRSPGQQPGTGGRKDLDARQRSPSRRKIGTLDAIVAERVGD